MHSNRMLPPACCNQDSRLPRLLISETCQRGSRDIAARARSDQSPSICFDASSHLTADELPQACDFCPDDPRCRVQPDRPSHQIATCPLTAASTAQQASTHAVSQDRRGALTFPTDSADRSTIETKTDLAKRIERRYFTGSRGEQKRFDSLRHAPHEDAEFTFPTFKCIRHGFAPNDRRRRSQAG